MTTTDLALDLDLYRTMLTIREFEARVLRLFYQGRVRSSSHLSTGMEAVAVGFAAAIDRTDYMFCTYRGHAHLIAKGAPLEGMFAELMGKESGLMGGKGGSMHLTSAEHGALGSFAIIGAQLPIAAGAAWSAQLRGSGQVSLCFFGDGATNIGAFHEALNLAAVWRLPVVFVCENNLYMEYTLTADVTAVPRPAADRASAYGLDPVTVDGNDVEAVREVAIAAVARARAGDGPSLIEALTYRHGGHAMSDPAKYRPEGELQRWMERDPVSTYRKQLITRGVGEHMLDTLDEEVAAEVDAAAEQAEQARPAPENQLLTNLWADGGSQWRN